jgi:hypothetical protein
MAEFAGRRMMQKSFLAECYANGDIWTPYVLQAPALFLPDLLILVSGMSVVVCFVLSMGWPTLTER